MKQIILILGLAIILVPAFLTAQEGGMPEPAEKPKPKGITLGDFISKIAELDEIGASDYFNMADATMQVAMSMLQQQQRVPDPPILDALDAVAEGRKLDPNTGDWDKLEKRLLDLLNNPPPEKQKQDQSKNSESEDGEKGEQDPQQSGEEESQEKGDPSKQEKSEQQDGKSGDQKQDEQQDGENQKPQNGESSEDGQQGEEKSAQKPNTQDGAQMGDLEKQEEGPQEVQLDGQQQEPPKTPEQMQSIGGQESSGEPVDAEKAALMQMLDQLKQQDEPGKLYKILQEAQSGKKQKPQPNTKDW